MVDGIPWRRSSDGTSGVREGRGRDYSLRRQEVLQVGVHQHEVGRVCTAPLLAWRTALRTAWTGGGFTRQSKQHCWQYAFILRDFN